MKNSTKTAIRLAALLVCVIPYQVKWEGDRKLFHSIRYDYLWNEKKTPSLAIRRND